MNNSQVVIYFYIVTLTLTESFLTSHMSCVAVHLSSVPVTNANSHSHIPSPAKSPTMHSSLKLKHLRIINNFAQWDRHTDTATTRLNWPLANSVKYFVKSPSVVRCDRYQPLNSPPTGYAVCYSSVH